jgi:hypothetical protein
MNTHYLKQHINLSAKLQLYQALKAMKKLKLPISLKTKKLLLEKI